MRKTKIICTLGPSVNSIDAIRSLILGGMSGARFNFSHGDHPSQFETLQKLRQAVQETGISVATILDTKGPEVRIQKFSTPSITLNPTDSFILTTEPCIGDSSRVSVTYPKLHEELYPGCRVLIDDGLIELRVEKINDKDIVCSVISGGILSSNKSINLPSVPLSLPSLTERDRTDLQFAVEHDFDFVAASFIRRASDVEDIRSFLKNAGGEDIRIIAKIENQEGIDHIDEIISAADGIMVARGDLGVEIPPFDVPVFQKNIIAKTLTAGKPVITATQMLDSMIRNPRPTRAEVSDVANAVFDGTSCVMLSGETASGLYPLQALEAMVKTIEAAEASIDFWPRFASSHFDVDLSVENAISHSCCTTAMDLNAAAILAATASGNTARRIARFRPACPIVALTLTERACRQLALSWGVYPFLSGHEGSTDELFATCVKLGKQKGFLKSGDLTVITAGVPIGQSGTTNLIKAQIVL